MELDEQICYCQMNLCNIWKGLNNQKKNIVSIHILRSWSTPTILNDCYRHPGAK